MVAVLTDYFPPATRGGAVRALSALVRVCSSRIDFRIVTRDHDALTGHPLPVPISDRWVEAGGVRVLYLSKQSLGHAAIRRALEATQPGLIFLNSLFSRLSQRLLWSRWINPADLPPIILAPEGELSPGALSQKRWKKSIWLQVARATGLLHGVVWKAANPQEAVDVRGLFPRATVWTIPHCMHVPALDGRRAQKVAGRARLLFLSRITGKKNLPFLLKALRHAPANTELAIVGPVEDQRLWRECKALIAALPPAVRALYLGESPPDEVWRHYLAADAFVLPTLGENHGYVIEDALRMGCIPVISDQTPWNGIASAGAGFVIPLDDAQKWRDAFTSIWAMDDVQHATARASGLRYLQGQLPTEGVEREYEKMFVAPHSAQRS